jgi:hypothetical protein
MAKISISTDSKIDGTRGLNDMTVAQALRYMASKGHGGTGEEDISDAVRAERAIVYAARRMMALNKDSDRIEAGKAPERIYTPRVNVKGAAKNAAEIKDKARQNFAKALHLKLVIEPPVRNTPAAKRGAK